MKRFDFKKIRLPSKVLVSAFFAVAILSGVEAAFAKLTARVASFSGGRPRTDLQNQVETSARQVVATARDGRAYRYDSQADTIAIGDLHGNFRGFVDILYGCGLIDVDMNWTGHEKNLVILGDLFSGQADSRLIIDLIMKLEVQASEAGGGVDTIYGNHELLVLSGDVSKMSATEKARFTRLPIDNADYKNMEEVLKNSKYGRWLEGLNDFVIINGTLFSHAGIIPKSLSEDFEISDLNYYARQWASYWVDPIDHPKPVSETKWIVKGETSPSWNKVYGADTGADDAGNAEDTAPKAKAFKKFLASIGVDRMVIGHRPLPDAEIILDHEYYGPRLSLIDTKISDEKHGKLRALRVTAAGEVSSLAFQRTSFGKKLKENYLTSLKTQCSSLF